MENDEYIFHFTFEPKKLSRIRHDVERRYKDIDRSIAEQLTAYRLPVLLELIRQTSPDQIESIAATLKRRDINVLLYGYPYKSESHDTKRKINIILSSRYSGGIGKYVWNLFQHEYEDVYLQDLLRRIYAVDAFEFLIPDQIPELDNYLVGALASKEGIAQGFVPLLADGEMISTKLFKNLEIKENSPLEMFLLFEMLKKGLAKDNMIKRESESLIRLRLERYALNDYQELIKIYLEARTHESFDPLLLEQAVIRLHDPREREDDWTFLNETALAEVNRWLVVNELKKFFEGDANRRFDYWERYLHYIVNVEQLKGNGNLKVAFIYFADFVVVEFGIIGAAYFYHRDGFDRWILTRTQTREFRSRSISYKEKCLKDTTKIMKETPLFIHKMSHSGGWTVKFTRYMQHYLDGIYDYDELWR